MTLIIPELALPTGDEIMNDDPQDYADKLTVASLNIRHGMSLKKKLADVDKIVDVKADFAGLQEIGSDKDRDAIRARLQKAGYGLWAPPNEGASTPVVFKSPVEDKGSYFLSPRTYVGDKGAGPDHMKAKYISYVKASPNGVSVIFGSCHLVPSIYIPVRKRLHNKEVARICQWCEFWYPKALPILVGDFNATPSQLTAINKTGMRGNTPIPTHGNRAIDRVFATSKPKNAQSIPVNSDHNMLVATIPLRVKDD